MDCVDTDTPEMRSGGFVWKPNSVKCTGRRDGTRAARPAWSRTLVRREIAPIVIHVESVLWRGDAPAARVYGWCA